MTCSRDRTEDQGTPARKAVSRENEHIGLLAFEDPHQVTDNVVAGFKAGGDDQSLSPHLLLTVFELSLHRLAFFAGDDEFWKEVRAVEVWKLGEDVNQVDCRMELLRQPGGRFQCQLPKWC